MGEWVLYAAAIVGAWTAASATITLAEQLGKRKTAFRLAPKSGHAERVLPNENTIIVAEIT